MKEEAREVKLDEKRVMEQIKEAAKKKEVAKEGDMSRKLGSIPKEEKKKVERVAIAYIFSSANNTMV